MKKTNLLKIFISVFAFVAFFSVTNVNATISINYAKLNEAEMQANHQPFYYSNLPISYGTYNTSDFRVDVFASANGSGSRTAMAPAICMLPNAKSPKLSDGSGIWRSDRLTNSGAPELQVLNNSNIEKYLYYGLCPTGCTRDIAKEVYTSRHNTDDIPRGNRVVMVHSAMAYRNLEGKDNFEEWHYGLNSTAMNDTLAFMQAVDAADYPGDWRKKPEGPGYYVYRVGNDTAQSLGLIFTVPYNLKVNKRTEPAVSGVSLEGAEYTIYWDSSCTRRAIADDKGNPYPVLRTDANGNTQDVTVVMNQKYWVKETRRPNDPNDSSKENEKFEYDETCYPCDLMNNDTCDINSKDRYDEDETGHIIIKKVDETDKANPALSTAKFTIYKGECGTGEFVEEMGINATSGQRRNTTQLEVGTEYCVRETTVPNNYTGAEDQKFTITDADADDNYTIVVTFKNIKKVKGSVTVKKIDNNGTVLEGADFRIYKNEDCSGSGFRTITSGADGIASTSNLDPGEYCLKETKAPTGFKMDEEIHPFTISEGQADVELADIVNTAVKGRIRITKAIDAASGIKYDLNKNSYYSLSGAEFNVYKDVCGTGTLEGTVKIPNGQSYAYIEDLEIGTYCVEEKTAPKGYDRSDEQKTVQINTGGTVFVTFEDTPLLGTVRLKKVSSNPSLEKSDPKKYSLKGATFDIKDKDGNLVGILTVDENGDSNVLHELPFGEYYATETKAPDVCDTATKEKPCVYEIDKNIYPVTIDATHPDGVFSATDKFVKGKAYVNKVPAEEPDGTCTLKGAEYKVCADEDLKGPDCVTLVTDENGKTQTEELEPGVYYFQEQKAPDCFEVNPEIQRIVVASGVTVEVTSKEELIPVNPQTGIDNPYLITITTVAIGGAGLYFLRRKNAFRQI